MENVILSILNLKISMHYALLFTPIIGEGKIVKHKLYIVKRTENREREITRLDGLTGTSDGRILDTVSVCYLFTGYRYSRRHEVFG